MGIQISSPESKPAITYDRIHMTRLDIDQPIQTDDTAMATYGLTLYYRLYGVVNGVRHYKDGDVQKITIPSFLTEAISAQSNGNDTLMNAFAAVEQAVAVILSEKAGLQATTV